MNYPIMNGQGLSLHGAGYAGWAKRWRFGKISVPNTLEFSIYQTPSSKPAVEEADGRRLHHM